MKKIMFNDQYGLTKAVLEGRKTMTRRLVPAGIMRMAQLEANMFGENLSERLWEHSPILCETVSIAQSYAELYKVLAARHFKRTDVLYDEFYHAMQFAKVCDTDAGWNNKMFVKADLMPYKIHITSVHAERLQDITEEDAMCEGIFKYDQPPLHHESDMYSPWPPHVRPYKFDHDNHRYFCNARAAFAYLIDKVSGRGTWKSNPYVFVYSFRLINQS